MTIMIREYEPKDLETARGLWRVLTERHRDIYEDPTIGGDDPAWGLDELLKRKDLASLWLAEVDDEVVGMCGLLFDGYEAELEPIVVLPEHRSRGVGAALAKQVLAKARELPAKYLNVRPVGRNREAIAFFRREGFEILGRLELCISLEESATTWEAETEIHGIPFRY